MNTSLVHMALLASLFLLCLPQAGVCGVSTDGTLGPASTLGGPSYAITANLGRQSGGNLFHSFSQFSLVSGEKAIFSGSAGTTAIISRVTGGASSIDGTISSTIPGANLFLVNPAGITFGPHASLDVSGSFHASTASYVQLGSSGRFPSDPAAAMNLTVDPPSKFGFLKSPAPVAVNGSFLTVPQGKTLSVTAGDITLADANLWSYGGTIALASLASPGEVNSATYATTASTLGTIRISDTRPFLSGGPVYTTPEMKGLAVANVDASGNGGGRIFIRGGAFYMNNGYIFNDTYGSVAGALTDIQVTGKIELSSSSSITGNGMPSGSASGGAITLAAGNILIRNSFINTDTWNSAKGSNLSLLASGDLAITEKSFVSADANGGAKAGNVSADAGNITIDSGSRVSSSAPVYGAGSTSGAGSVSVHAAQSLSLKGDIRSESAEGTNGNITIVAPELTLSGFGFISSSLLVNTSTQAGRSGDIIIESNKLSLSDHGRIESRTLYSNNGSSGDIRIKTGTLSLTGGGAITSSIDSVTGNGGSIIIDAAESITVASVPTDLFREFGSIASDSTAGNAGQIILNAPRVSITGGGSLTTIVQGGTGRGGDITVNASERILIDGGYQAGKEFKRSLVSTDTFGAGNAGNISLTAPDVSVSGGSLVSSIADVGSSGNGGNIGVKAGQSLTVQGGKGQLSQVSVETRGLGNAGAIAFDTSSLTVADGGTISAAARKGSSGNGGLITISASDRIVVSGGADGGVVSGNSDSSGNGAHIQITAPSVEVLAGGFITAETGPGSSGTGGDIRVNSRSTLISGGTVSSATKGSGNAGTIQLDGTELTVRAGGIISTSADIGAPGKAGNIDLTIGGVMKVQGAASQVTSNTYRGGDGGNITIAATSLDVSDGAIISTSTEAGSSGHGGNIGIKTGQTLTVQGGSGRQSRISVETGGDGDAGSIAIGTPVLTLADGGIISASTLAGSRGNGGVITVTAGDRVVVSGGADLAGISGNTASSGSGAHIQITAPSVEVLAGGFITAETGPDSRGKGGNIRISSNSALISGGKVSSATRGMGSAGTIQLDGTNLSVRDGGIISTSADTGASGKAGNIDLTIGGALKVQGVSATTASQITSSTHGSGDSGSITIAAASLDVRDGGIVSTSAEAGSAGTAGNIGLTIGGAMTVQGAAATNASHITSNTYGKGDGGTVTISAATLDVTNGGFISTSAEPGSSGSGGNIAINAADSLSVSGAAGPLYSHISSDTSGSGEGGHVSVTTADFQLLDRGSLRTRSSGTGNAGDIQVTAHTLSMYGGAVLDSSSLASGTMASGTENSRSAGAAGNISISLRNDAHITGSMLTTQSATSEGGNITLSTPAGVTIDHGELSASATAGAGNGGNVMLSGGTIILRGGKITAQAERGNGGNLDIHANLFIASADSTISASSRFGTQGTVQVDAPAVDIGAVLARQPGDFIGIDSFLPKRCMMPGDEDVSVLMLSGGAAPSLPASLFPLIIPADEGSQSQAPMNRNGDQK